MRKNPPTEMRFITHNPCRTETILSPLIKMHIFRFRSHIWLSRTSTFLLGKLIKWLIDYQSLRWLLFCQLTRLLTNSTVIHSNTRHMHVSDCFVKMESPPFLLTWSATFQKYSKCLHKSVYILTFKCISFGGFNIFVFYRRQTSLRL